MFVEYTAVTFDLGDPHQLFEFIFRCYGWLHSLKDLRSQLSHDFSQIRTSLQTLSGRMPCYRPARKSGFDKSTGRSRGANSSRGHVKIFPALGAGSLALIKEKGYSLSPEHKRLWPRNIAKAEKDGHKVALKLVGPHERDILRNLQRRDNYVVKLIDVIGLTDKSVIIVMPWLSPLGNHFSGPNASPILKSSLVAQFLAGVRFLHKHGFAHLDLKPSNILLDPVDGLVPRLSIIDFGISVRVRDEETTVTGFRGTPSWTAPEVGTENGPKMTYSAIRADRWSCGRMLEHFGSNDSLRSKLLDPDPSRRPSLDSVFQMLSAEIRRSFGTKRGLGDDTEGDASQKRWHAMPNMKEL